MEACEDFIGMPCSRDFRYGDRMPISFYPISLYAGVSDDTWHLINS